MTRINDEEDVSAFVDHVRGDELGFVVVKAIDVEGYWMELSRKGDARAYPGLVVEGSGPSLVVIL